MHNHIIKKRRLIMIKSMTGFGRGEYLDDSRKITVELKSVNHRYLDVNLKMPKKLNFFDSAIRNFLKEFIQRGKVDVYISYEDFTEGKVSVKFNEDLAKEYLSYFSIMEEKFHLKNDIHVSHLSRFQDVLTMEEQTVDEEELWEKLEVVLRQACVQFVESRVKEGDSLRNDMLHKLDEMLASVTYIEKRIPQIMDEYRKKLHDRIKDMLGDGNIDESRIITEVTIFSDKLSVDEETVRLKSHIQNTKDTLIKGGNVGRKLDFIAQEMNREANTILSKSNDLSISNVGIDLKTNIEKVREQIQNIE